jgi:hypothetical protein
MAGTAEPVGRRLLEGVATSACKGISIVIGKQIYGLPTLRRRSIGLADSNISTSNEYNQGIRK